MLVFLLMHNNLLITTNRNAIKLRLVFMILMIIINQLYPYFAIFTAVFLEGETALITASFLTKTGNLKLFLVMITAFTATLISDWTWFFIGRLKGEKLIAKKSTLQKMKCKAENLIAKYPLMIFFGYRYIYGMRTAIPLIIGTCHVKTSKFLLISLISIVIWTVFFSMLGFSFGLMVLKKFETILQYQKIIVGVIVIAGIITGLIIYRISRKKISE